VVVQLMQSARNCAPDWTNTVSPAFGKAGGVVQAVGLKSERGVE